MSHPPNTKSSRSLSGTNSFTSGERPSVRLPRRMVLSWVSEPTGCAFFFLTSSTPAMNVVLTAPIPGNKTPNLPLGGAIFAGFSIPLLLELESQYNSPIGLIYINGSSHRGTRVLLSPARRDCPEQVSYDARTPPILQITEPKSVARPLSSMPCSEHSSVPDDTVYLYRHKRHPVVGCR